MKWAGTPVAAEKLPPALRDRYRSYSFDEFDKRGAYAYRTINEWRALTERAMSILRPAIRKLKDAGLAITEWDVTNKLAVNWRDKGLGTLVQSQALIVDNKAQAEWLRPALRRKGALYAGWVMQQAPRELANMYYDATVPTRRGKGAPYWFAGSMPHAAEALAKLAVTANSVDELDRLLIESGGASMRPCITLDVRYQASSKPRPSYRLSGGELDEGGDRLRPKARKIQALPFSYNYLAVGVAAVMKAAMRGVSGRHGGTVTAAIDIGNSMATTFATDLSTYDDTISYETDAAWRSEVLHPLLRALQQKGVITRTRAIMIETIHEKIATIDSLGPPARTDEGARLVATRGANKSGQRFTSQEATDINDARIETKAHDLKIAIEWTNLGDDTLIGSEQDDAEEKWNNPDYDNHGFIETAAPDASFLMKRIPEDYGYVSRMIMACINREVRHEPENVYAAASAIAVRRSLIATNPLAPTFERVLNAMEGPLYDAYRLSLTTDVATLMLAQIAQMSATRLDAKDDLLQAIQAAYDTSTISAVTKEKLIAATDEVTVRSEMRYGEMEREMQDLTIGIATRYIAQHAYHKT